MNPAVIRLAKTVLKPRSRSMVHAESLRYLMVKRSKGSAAIVADMSPNDWGNLFKALKRDGVISVLGFHFACRPDAKGHILRTWVVR